ncbi:MAG: DUF1499 domain-containing protein [Rhodomicrobium sp.]
MRYYEHRSQKASWAYRVAILSVLVFAGAFVWHRFFGLPTPLALKIFGGAVAVAVISLALAAAALVNIWNEGSTGAGRASFAMFLSLLLLAVPLWSLPDLLNLPRLYDVTTDTASPPAFDRIAKIRQGQANAVHYEASFGPLQKAAYPDIKPLVVARPITDVYSAVRETIKGLNWKVIDERPPGSAKTGYIEAIDRTWIFGYTDDVAIRITGSPKAAKIDIRSSSRFGQHDLGRNAQRIRRFMTEVKARLAEIERGERMERLVASREAAEKEQSKRRRGARKQDQDDDN